jgi:hypothetical protein
MITSSWHRHARRLVRHAFVILVRFRAGTGSGPYIILSIALLRMYTASDGWITGCITDLDGYKSTRQRNAHSSK